MIYEIIIICYVIIIYWIMINYIFYDLIVIFMI